MLLTLRADFYARLAAYDGLRTAVAEHQVYIGPMSPEELRRAIEAPAEAGGWEFSPGLVDLILHDVGEEPGALPLLSHALLETWRRRRGNVMTLKAMPNRAGSEGRSRGPPIGSITPSWTTPSRDRASIFLRLTELGEGTQDTRRRVALSELVPAEDPTARSCRRSSPSSSTRDWSRQCGHGRGGARGADPRVADASGVAVPGS